MHLTCTILHGALRFCPMEDTTTPAGHSKADEDALVERARLGDRRAVAALYDRHNLMIHRFAWNYAPFQDEVEREDCFQEGVVGFMTAIERYDAARGVPFVYYAMMWIHAKLSHYTRRRKRAPLAFDEIELRRIADGQQEDSDHESVVAAGVDQSSVSNAVALAINALDHRSQQTLLRHREDVPTSQDKIGSRYGVTGSRIGEIERQAKRQFLAHPAIRALCRGER